MRIILVPGEKKNFISTLLIKKSLSAASDYNRGYLTFKFANYCIFFSNQNKI